MEYNDFEIALIWIDLFDELTYKKKRELLDLVDNPIELKNNIIGLKSKIVKIVTNDVYQKMLDYIENDYLKSFLCSYEKENIRAVTFLSEDYPESLKQIDTPPFVLYCKGDVSLMKKNCISIVGTRKISNYGKVITEKFTKGLLEAGFVIVSGLAYGVDTIAHTVTVDNDGKTIAVLAGGVNEIYPPLNTNLAYKIEKDGLLISETRPFKKTESYFFPIRNRIIAGLSKGVLITEAGLKSGSMHTKDYALEYGKDVFAVPGNINCVSSEGTNYLIVNGQAKPVIDVDNILDEYNIAYQPIVESHNYSFEESIILDILKNGEIHYQELLLKTKIDSKRLNTLLTSLEIGGIIKKLAGNYYCLN